MEFWKTVLYGVGCLILGYFVATMRVASVAVKAKKKVEEAEEILEHVKEIERAYEEMDLFEDLEE